MHLHGLLLRWQSACLLRLQTSMPVHRPLQLSPVAHAGMCPSALMCSCSQLRLQPLCTAIRTTAAATGTSSAASTSMFWTLSLAIQVRPRPSVCLCLEVHYHLEYGPASCASRDLSWTATTTFSAILVGSRPAIRRMPHQHPSCYRGDHNCLALSPPCSILQLSRIRPSPASLNPLLLALQA